MKVRVKHYVIEQEINLKKYGRVKSYMNKEIDNLFSDKNIEDISNDIKKKRKKYNSKIIAKATSITLVILIALNLLLNVCSDKVLVHLFNKRSIGINSEYNIMHPNEYIGGRKFLETTLFKALFIFDIGKTIGNKVVSSNTHIEVGGLLLGNVGRIYLDNKEDSLAEDISKRSYNTNGLRKLNFMLPYVNYENTINDFKYLDEINPNNYVEMVLSFDKEYSYEYVNKNIDSDKITFYWIDTTTDDDKSKYQEYKAHLNEHEVIGIKSLTYDGKIIKNINDRLNNFKESAIWLKSNKYRGFIGNIDENNTNISGIVVQGTPDELKKLQNNRACK